LIGLPLQQRKEGSEGEEKNKGEEGPTSKGRGERRGTAKGDWQGTGRAVLKIP